MTSIHEVAPDIFRLSVYAPEFDMQSNHFPAQADRLLIDLAGVIKENFDRD